MCERDATDHSKSAMITDPSLSKRREREREESV